MTFQEALDLLLDEVNVPLTQQWVTIEALKKAAENLDDDQDRRRNS
jgi:ATP:corrinoid adenosyltransferase